MALTKQDLQAIKEIVHDPLEKQIDNLAISVNNSFEKYDAKNELRFQAIDERFDSVDGSLAVIKGKLKISSDDYENHEKRIKVIEKKLEISK